jgi:NAD-dependent deacetylase
MTGAGVSAASGVPTFRGAASTPRRKDRVVGAPDGLWRNFRVETLATPDAFARDPKLVWEWYDWRRRKIAACAPNAAHHVLAEWSRRFSNFTLITQNVDGLHERAGTADTVRLHGSIWEVECWDRCAASPPRWREETVPFVDLPPRCPHCGGLIRPGVVWFGEPLDSGIVARAMMAANCDVFIAVGTSAVVYPAAGFVDLARRAGAFTVEINLEATPASGGIDLSIRGAAESVLPDVSRIITL